ncbi:LysE family translocator [Megalodesulfovibrio gigas]|uniref:Putative lysine exporter protein LysE/YggA n=1 Tax=Megalodesulfovibrio gigas (strain ATCC 19364 / DSM 1382 / NCIMB 9332 / VKM B-1759) TaxID=1121448 RepID=T2G8N6_MEGG1|nr:LysE family translocator [Megalodesulfovibrio gigas]AGW12638.1 putative lysine exporter protein LysE/YggA [Megalodesulfovibrio gigas DSM 1382 = ATCC 19364]
MTTAVLLSYVLTCLVVLAIPGPTVLLVVGVSLREGPRAAVPLALGVALGDALAISLSLAGLGAVLASSAALFIVVKYCGAAYCIYLGWRMWRDAPGDAAGAHLTAAADTSSHACARRITGRAFLVTALNPKSITFFVAFLPQFLNPAAPLAPQALVLGSVFVSLATVNALTYATLAGRCTRFFRRPGAVRLFHRLGGGCLMTAGAAVALEGADAS